MFSLYLFVSCTITQKLWAAEEPVRYWWYGMVWYGIVEFNVPLDTV